MEVAGLEQVDTDESRVGVVPCIVAVCERDSGCPWPCAGTGGPPFEWTHGVPRRRTLESSTSAHGHNPNTR